MNVSEASKKTGVSTDTIRYYEKDGLIPLIDRNESGNREIDEKIIRRITFAKQMRAAGMSIKALKQYINLVDDSEDNTVSQKQLLHEQVEAMEERRDDIQFAINHLNYKLEHYDDHMRATEAELHELERK
ncbi:MerR family transcriptional regulator [Weissella koreensis]|uniref:MerR family transcriptional regulator n=1 Tax=Weissella koreensis TaxID=165096 RepID=A0A7H1MKZ8_9LACO|nr:MerR family transcriptional regulator [Weissella koreensis]AVH74931.1 MerR family transcriptional regulator [Weissella koreensis]QGN20155.1 MerR family transcriptional regulator [Weissella koreensis]QNT64134.1 MerR family transcriptional regulator [Weissella koreensis]